MRSRRAGGMVSRMLAVHDEQHLGQVEGQVDVVVLEGVVLLRVQHLEQGRRRVAAEVRAQLVHLVEHEHRVLALRAAQALDDLAGQGADVGAAVAADLRLVAHAAQADAVELAAHGGGDRPAQRLVLPTPGGPTKHRMGPLMSGFILRTARYSRMRSLTFSRS